MSVPVMKMISGSGVSESKIIKYTKIIKMGKEMPAGLAFIVQAILGMMGSQSLLHVGALSVRLSEGFIVLMAVCSVSSSCVLYLVVVSMVVMSQAILCPVVREWWAGAD